MIKEVKVWRYLLKVTLSVSLLVISPSTSSFITVTVKASVYRPLSCVINGNQPIEVSFGNEVMTTRVSETDSLGNYAQQVKYSLVCTGGHNALRLKIQGENAGFNPRFLATTEQSDLAIAFWANNSLLPVNSWLNFTYPTLPVLQAAPVKRTGSVLEAGKFSAAATMKIEVQ